MRPVKTRPRFHCDFCSKVLTRAAMERHEIICWRNPERYCDVCENTGKWYEDYGPDIGGQWFDCYFCGTFDQELADRIAETKRLNEEAQVKGY